jgi:hypothetical protein
MKVQVDIPAARVGHSSPERFRLGSQSIEIVDVLDRWHGHDADHFRVRGSDGHTYVLRCMHTAEHPRAWEMVSFTHKDSRGSSLHPAAATTRIQ